MHHKLDTILNQGSKLKILRMLYLQKGEHTGREIARSIRMSPSVVSGALHELCGEGLISIRTVGRAHLYGLIEDNQLIKKSLGPLFEGEKSILGDIISTIGRGLSPAQEEIVSLALFGSVAGGDEKPGSDIDVLVVTRTSQGKARVEKLLEATDPVIMGRFRTALSHYIKTRSEIRAAYRDQKPMIRSILTRHRLISGEPLERVIS